MNKERYFAEQYRAYGYYDDDDDDDDDDDMDEEAMAAYEPLSIIEGVNTQQYKWFWVYVCDAGHKPALIVEFLCLDNPLPKYIIYKIVCALYINDDPRIESRVHLQDPFTIVSDNNEVVLKITDPQEIALITEAYLMDYPITSILPF